MGAPLAIGWIALMICHDSGGVLYAGLPTPLFILTSAAEGVGVVVIGILLVLLFDALWQRTRPRPVTLTPDEIALLSDDDPPQSPPPTAASG